MASSISDPLTLLREYTIAKKTVTREGGHIVFDRTRFAASALTAYRGGDGFYSIESLWFMLQHAETGAGRPSDPDEAETDADRPSESPDEALSVPNGATVQAPSDSRSHEGACVAQNS